MRLVEIFLPLQREDGEKVPRSDLRAVIEALADRFGGATAFTRAPAEGLWKQEAIERDRMMLIEVLVEVVDREWWQQYRRQLEERLDQKQILIRVTHCDLI